MSAELEKCPRCFKMTLKRGTQTTLDGEELRFVYCTRTSCGYQNPTMELKF